MTESPDVTRTSDMAERAGAGARLRRVEHIMGTVFSFDVRGAGPRAAAALETAVAWLHHVDEVFSTYRPESQISRLAAGRLALSACSPEVWEVLRLCEAAERRSDGWFSTRHAGGFDPTGLVKGWAVERAAAMLSSAGAEAVCVNGGGDVQVHGGPWRIGVSDPLRRGRVATVVPAYGRLAVATSGPAERGCHITDPRTGRAPATAPASLTVICRGLTDADAYATAGYAMGGDRARSWLDSLPGTRSLAINADGTTWTTDGRDQRPPRPDSPNLRTGRQRPRPWRPLPQLGPRDGGESLGPRRGTARTTRRG